MNIPHSVFLKRLDGLACWKGASAVSACKRGINVVMKIGEATGEVSAKDAFI